MSSQINSDELVIENEEEKVHTNDEQILDGTQSFAGPHDEAGPSSSLPQVIQPEQPHQLQHESQSTTSNPPPANAELATLSTVLSEDVIPVSDVENTVDLNESFSLGKTQSSEINRSRQYVSDGLWLGDSSNEREMMRELERANLARIFEDEDDAFVVERVATANGMINSENADLHTSEIAATDDKIVANSKSHSKKRSTKSTNLTSRAVNILPASMNLSESKHHNFIAIGRRPKVSTNESRALAANLAGDAPLGWQASMSSLKERLAFLYCNDLHADVYFIVGRDEHRQRIPAHTFLLWIGSDIFDAMFKGGLTPNSRDAHEIELPDVEPSAFLTLLKYLYTDEVNIGAESVMTTLYTAKKYGVPALENACIDFLKQNLGADNAFMLLSQARLFDERQLEQLCLEIIDKNTHDALRGDGFTEIDQDTLCAFLSRDTLRIREASLFHATVLWATEECKRRNLDLTADNKREVLGRALNLVRFPLMNVEEFAHGPAQSGLLTDRQALDLFLYFTVNPKPNCGFSDRARAPIPGSENVVNRFQRIETRWGYNGTSDRIKFTVDRPIYVVGFGLFGAITGPEEYEVTIELIHCGTGNTLAMNETSFVCDGSSSTNRVLFKEPVHISPGVTYIASACLKGGDTYYGTKGLRRLVHQATGVTFQFTYAAVNNNGTSVEDGQIPEIIFHTKAN